MTPPLLLVLVTVIAGAAGGLASHFLDRGAPAPDDGTIPQPLSRRGADAGERVFVGIVAAFIVPLFLSMTQSDLVKGILTAGVDPDSDGSGLFNHDLFVIGGFCILAGFSARWFLSSVAKQALSVARDAKRDAEHARATTRKIEALLTRHSLLNSVKAEQTAQAAPVEEPPRDDADRIAALVGPEQRPEKKPL